MHIAQDLFIGACRHLVNEDDDEKIDRNVLVSSRDEEDRAEIRK